VYVRDVLSLLVEASIMIIKRRLVKYEPVTIIIDCIVVKIDFCNLKTFQGYFSA